MLFRLRRDPNCRLPPTLVLHYMDVLRVIPKPGRQKPYRSTDVLFYCDTNMGQKLIDGEALPLAILRREFRLLFPMFVDKQNKEDM